MWEHQIIKAENAANNARSVQDILCREGAKGWELVAVSLQFTTYLLFLKRKARTE